MLANAGTFDSSTGLEVIAETIAAGKVGAVVPVTTCPWYRKPEIGESDLVCTFPSNAVLLLGAASIAVLAFLSVRS